MTRPLPETRIPGHLQNRCRTRSYPTLFLCHLLLDRLAVFVNDDRGIRLSRDFPGSPGGPPQRNSDLGKKIVMNHDFFFFHPWPPVSSSSTEGSCPDPFSFPADWGLSSPPAPAAGGHRRGRRQGGRVARQLFLALICHRDYKGESPATENAPMKETLHAEAWKGLFEAAFRIKDMAP